MRLTHFIFKCQFFFKKEKECLLRQIKMNFSAICDSYDTTVLFLFWCTCK